MPQIHATITAPIYLATKQPKNETHRFIHSHNKVGQTYEKCGSPWEAFNISVRFASLHVDMTLFVNFGPHRYLTPSMPNIQSYVMLHTHTVKCIQLIVMMEMLSQSDTKQTEARTAHNFIWQPFSMYYNLVTKNWSSVSSGRWMVAHESANKMDSGRAYRNNAADDLYNKFVRSNELPKLVGRFGCDQIPLDFIIDQNVVGIIISGCFSHPIKYHS